MTEKQIEAQIRSLEKTRNNVDKEISVLEEMQRSFLEKESLSKSKFKVGQRVEYRLTGSKTLRFGQINNINVTRFGALKYLVERIDAKGNVMGFGNEVQEIEIFGCSTVNARK